jgi:hypothetical protein
MQLTLERRDQTDRTRRIAGVAITPNINEDYWTYRVRLSDKQAIVGFPKFNTIGIGFAVEEDWNTNFPYTVDAEETFQHIRDNKGDDAISDDDVRAAIALVQQAAREGPGRCAMTLFVADPIDSGEILHPSIVDTFVLDDGEHTRQLTAFARSLPPLRGLRRPDATGEHPVYRPETIGNVDELPTEPIPPTVYGPARPDDYRARHRAPTPAWALLVTGAGLGWLALAALALPVLAVLR